MSFPHGFSQLPPLTSRGRIRWVPLRQRGCGLPPAFPERPRSMSFTWANLDAKMWENVGWSWWMIQMIVNASLFWGEVYNCIHGAWRIYKEIIHQHPMNMSLFTATGISDYPRQRVAGLPNRFAGACFGTFGTNCLQKVRDSESMLCDLCVCQSYLKNRLQQFFLAWPTYKQSWSTSNRARSPNFQTEKERCAVHLKNRSRVVPGSCSQVKQDPIQRTRDYQVWHMVSKNLPSARSRNVKKC